LPGIGYKGLSWGSSGTQNREVQEIREPFPDRDPASRLVKIVAMRSERRGGHPFGSKVTLPSKKRGEGAYPSFT